MIGQSVVPVSILLIHLAPCRIVNPSGNPIKEFPYVVGS